MTQSFQLTIPERAPLFSRVGWLTLCAVVIGVFLFTLLGTQWAAPDSALHISDYTLTLVGKMLCYAIVAMSLNLVWGYCGILSLGHGLYFALGGYAMGMYLVQAPVPGQETAGMPAFTFLLNWTELPWYWTGTQNLFWVIALAALVPGIVAFIFGYFAFRSRIKGVYLSIMTQAVTYAAMLLFFRNETGFGGNNGFTDFKSIAGYSITSTDTRTVLFLISFVMLILVFVLVQWIMKSRFGKVITAIRDSESRVMFIGFNPLQYKLAIWTLSAALCGIAGALYAPLVGIINPGEMSPVNSIEMVIWVAVGGRGSLVGSILGVFTVNGAKTFFTAFLPEYWLYILGGLFVVVTLFMPKGLIGLFARRPRSPKAESTPATASDAI
ncbi:urea ABC transporter permease subunit UrtC [Advenella mimigardefordensis]|uniref:Putative urea ABC transporter permease protein UrtC n=1 Tax=Advenella mimigardefordensis (strain DSM 17166 / LMG 22922 / DPN7) TaxID=1247726 RepID=W0PGI4_ADVMD|nr:urea ABC transporter permease subunit UrtC [Advenella mimigardefordensis]AHG64285.1 putative urea ABC transporter permease protein UrtC [Advenella mimigardefordensis DPN7]